MINQVEMSETGNNPDPRLDFCYQPELTTNCRSWLTPHGLFHFYSVHTVTGVWRCTIPGGPLRMIFSRGFYYKVYFSSRGNLHNYKPAASYLFGMWDWKIFSSISFFFLGIKSTKFHFQGVYESNNHSIQVVLIFKNLFIHTPVWIKMLIAQC